MGKVAHRNYSKKQTIPCPPKARINRTSTCSFITNEEVAWHAADTSRYVLCGVTNRTDHFVQKVLRSHKL